MPDQYGEGGYGEGGYGTGAAATPSTATGWPLRICRETCGAIYVDDPRFPHNCALVLRAGQAWRRKKL